jgi:hypothetical protein
LNFEREEERIGKDLVLKHSRTFSDLRVFLLPVSILAVVFTFFISSTAFAAERARVALAMPADPDDIQAEVATRIRAELETALFEVVTVPLDAGTDPRQGVESAAIEPKPIATVAVVRLQNRPAVDVWVSDRVTGKTLVKRVDVGRKADAEITSALAIHAVELLRASLLEMRTQSARREARTEGPSPIPNEVVDWVDRAVLPEKPKPLYARPAISVAAAAIYSATGMGPAFAPVVRASVGAPNGVAARISFAGPGFGAELKGARGTAFVRQELALAEFVYAPSRRWLSPIFSIGVGGYHLYTRGESTDPAYGGATSEAWAILADAGIGLAARLTPGAAILLDVHGFMTQPSTHLYIGDASIGTVGRPSSLTSLGLVATF